MTVGTPAPNRSRRAAWLGSWRVALRLARRDALRSKGRTLLVAAMVGIPVLLVGILSTVYHTNKVQRPRVAARAARREPGADPAAEPKRHEPEPGH